MPGHSVSLSAANQRLDYGDPKEADDAREWAREMGKRQN